MTPGQRKAMYLACLHGAAHTLTYERSPKWGGNAGRALQDARRALASAIMELDTVTPALPRRPPSSGLRLRASP